MADASSYFAIRTITVDNATWAPVTTPIGCNTWSIRPDSSIKIRSDQTDITTEDTISAGMQDTFQVQGGSGARFPANTTFAYVQAVSGTAIVHVQFAR